MQHSHSINVEACSIAPSIYERRRPEETTLYQVISKYYADFLSYLTDMGKRLPSYVTREFEDYLRCGQLENGFLRVRCDDCFDEKRGLLSRDAEQSYLTFDYDAEDVINDLIGSSITYRVAVGKNKEKKVYTLQTIPAQLEEREEHKSLAEESGFSLHAGVSAKSYQKDKIERLCRYITRPAVSLKRLRLSETGKVIYELKNPYKNGTTHVAFEPLDFIARLAALVPTPWMNLTRFHGVFAPNSKYRKVVTGYDKSSVEEPSTTTINPKHRYRMLWAERLKRVFNIDITICQQCHGNVRIVACINDKTIIDKILAHIDKRDKDLKEVFNTFTIRGPPELVSLITSNISNDFKC